MKVGFYNGCFDLFHAGHHAALHACRMHCEFLIVAVNSDASVRRLKGAGRPQQDWAIRSGEVMETGLVDAVIPFEGDEMQLLMAIRPDVLFKGYDHTEDAIYYRKIGWKHRDWPHWEGPQVVRLPMLPGHSTTDRIARDHAT